MHQTLPHTAPRFSVLHRIAATVELLALLPLSLFLFSGSLFAIFALYPKHTGSLTQIVNQHAAHNKIV